MYTHILTLIHLYIRFCLYRYIADLRPLFDESADRHHPRSRWHLPKHSLLFIIAKIQRNSALNRRENSRVNQGKISVFEQFDYIYYTEADQILYMRSQRHIMDALDRQNKTLLIVPHRMHTLIIPQVYTTLMSYMPPNRISSTKNIKLITEGQNYARGSWYVPPAYTILYICIYTFYTYYIHAYYIYILYI